jgi:hypothetical protein
MRHKILVIGLIFILLTSSISFGETTDFSELVDMMIESNTSLQSIEMNINKLFFTEEETKLDSRLMAKSIEDLSKIHEDYRPKGDPLQGMYYVRDIVPQLVAKNVLDLNNTYKSTLVTMTNALRQLVLGVANADMAYDLSVSKYDYYKSQYETAVLKYNFGLITTHDVTSAEILMLTYESAMNNQMSGLEIANLTLNKHLGVPTYVRFEFDLDLTYREPSLSEDKYISMALEYRKEILDIQANIDMANIEIAHLEENEDYKYGRNVLDKKKDQQDNIVRYNLQMKETIAFVEKDIRLAFNALETSTNSILKLKNTLAEQEQTYFELENQMKLGNVTSTQLKQLELGITEIKNNLKVLEYSHAVNLEKFYHAVEYGPAYNGGSLK